MLNIVRPLRKIPTKVVMSSGFSTYDFAPAIKTKTAPKIAEHATTIGSIKTKVYDIFVITLSTFNPIKTSCSPIRSKMIVFFLSLRQAAPIAVKHRPKYR